MVPCAYSAREHKAHISAQSIEKRNARLQQTALSAFWLTASTRRAGRKLKAFISRVLTPLVTALAGEPGIGAWEIMNDYICVLHQVRLSLCVSVCVCVRVCGCVCARVRVCLCVRSRNRRTEHGITRAMSASFERPRLLSSRREEGRGTRGDSNRPSPSRRALRICGGSERTAPRCSRRFPVNPPCARAQCRASSAKKRVLREPATAVLLSSTFLKLASILDVPLIRISQCDSPDQVNHAHARARAHAHARARTHTRASDTDASASASPPPTPTLPPPRHRSGPPPKTVSNAIRDASQNLA